MTGRTSVSETGGRAIAGRHRSPRATPTPGSPATSMTGVATSPHDEDRESILPSAASQQPFSRSAFSSAGSSEAGLRCHQEPEVIGCDGTGDAELDDIMESPMYASTNDLERTSDSTEAGAGAAMYLGPRGMPMLAAYGTDPPEPCVASMSRLSLPSSKTRTDQTEFYVIPTQRTDTRDDLLESQGIACMDAAHAPSHLACHSRLRPRPRVHPRRPRAHRSHARIGTATQQVRSQRCPLETCLVRGKRDLEDLTWLTDQTQYAHGNRVHAQRQELSKRDGWMRR